MIYRAQRRELRIALAGDVMPSRRLAAYDEDDYRALVALLHDSDLAFANLETTVRERDEGAPNFTQGTPMSTPPALLEDLKWMGIGVLSIANNHTTDYGGGGVMATAAHLRRASLPYAGAGAHLAEARAPAYVDTAAGRVGVVAATSFFRPWNRAADQRPDAAGRPGINPLGFSSIYAVDAEAFSALRRVSDQLGFSREAVRRRGQFYSEREAPVDDDSRLSFLGAQFRHAGEFGVTTRVDRSDAEANLRAIREARRQSDWVLFSFHFHEFGDEGRRTANSDVELTEPAQFVVDFARAAIDAGADMVAGHGPHLTLGVEIYKERPILYSLGNFVFQNDTVEVFPAEAYARFGLPHDATPADFLDARTHKDTRGFPAAPQFWQSIVATCDFSAGRLDAVHLRPLDLGHGCPRSQRGRPLLARGAVAQASLARVRALSRRFGTEVEVDGDQARVRA